MWKMALKAWLLYAAIGLVSLMAVTVGSLAIGTILGALLYIGFILMVFGEASSEGEHGCSVNETIEKLNQENKPVPNELKKQAYKVSKGIWAALILVAPLVVCAVINLIVADPNSLAEKPMGVVTRIVMSPLMFVTRLCTENLEYDVSGTVKMMNGVLGSVSANGVSITSLLTAAKQNDQMLIDVIDTHPLTTMRVLFIPGCILPGLALVGGYLCGPKLRKRTLNEMLKGTRKKLRKINKGRGSHPRSLKPEV